MQNNKFKFIDIFAGIGGFRTAMERHGGECVFSSEINPHAQQAYNKLYGHMPQGDIRKIEASDIPDFDILCGGFPCQSFSFAGKKLGFADEVRGTLFFEIARIAAEKKPKFLFLENVKGLVSHDSGRTLDVIVRTLSDLGYSVDFQILNSKYYGVPQNRERIYIIGVLMGEQAPYMVPKKKSVCSVAKQRMNKYGDLRTFNFDWPDRSVVEYNIADIMEENVDEKYYLSEDKTSKLIEVLANREKLPEQRLSKMQMVGLLHARGTEQTRRVYDVNGLAPTLMAHSGGSTEPKIAYLENDIVMEFSEGSGITCCLDANYSKGVSPNCVGKGRRTHILEPSEYQKRKWKIRKLTPRECFRLQSFPEHYITMLHAEGIKDTQLYKMAGNAVTVNTIQAIGEKILHYGEAFQTDSNKQKESVLSGFAENFKAFITQNNIKGRYRTTELFSDWTTFQTENNLNCGVSNVVSFGSLLSSNLDSVVALGSQVCRTSKYWEIGGRTDQVGVFEESSEVLDKLSSFTVVMKKYIRNMETGSKMTTTELYNEVKRFSLIQQIDDPGLSNPIYFGTVLSKNIDKINDCEKKLEKHKKFWTLV